MLGVMQHSHYATLAAQVVGKIGEGTYGVVYLARSKQTQNDRLLAVKTFKTGRVGIHWHWHTHRRVWTRCCRVLSVCQQIVVFVVQQMFTHTCTGGGWRLSDCHTGNHAVAGAPARKHSATGQRAHQPTGTLQYMSAHCRISLILFVFLFLVDSLCFLLVFTH